MTLALFSPLLRIRVWVDTVFRSSKQFLFPFQSVATFWYALFFLIFKFSKFHLRSVIQAILDTCHSGTLLDLPHYHCNSVYVPWESKGNRRTMTKQNINGLSPLPHRTSHILTLAQVRRQATDRDFTNSEPPRSIEATFDNQPVDPGSRQNPPAGTQVRGLTNQSELSSESQCRSTRRSRDRTLFASQRRCASPEPRFVCDGWCKYSDVSHPNVVRTPTFARLPLAS
jgi:hypothetical protein